MKKIILMTSETKIEHSNVINREVKTAIKASA